MTYNTYMKKPNAVHTVTRSAARFGVPDPKAVCDLLADSVPSYVLKDATNILDLGQGCCGISRSVVKRIEREGYADQYEAMFRVRGVDNDFALVKKAQRLGFVNSVCTDIDDLDDTQLYELIVGNPPYQNPNKKNKAANSRSSNGSPLWAKFVKKGANLLAPGGCMSLLLPSAILNPGGRGMSGAKNLTLIAVKFGMEKHFNVSTDISLVTWMEGDRKDLPLMVNGLEYPRELPIANVQSQGELDLLKSLWSGSSGWKYMDNRGHHKINDKENYLVIRRMYSGDTYSYNRGLDMSKFDKESLVGLRCTEEESQKWISFFESDKGRFLRRVTNFAGNVSASHLKYVNPDA